MRLVILIVLMIFSSCMSTKQITPYSFIHDPVDNSRLQFNGFYNTLDTISLDNEGNKSYKHLTALYWVIFNKNQKIYVSSGASTSTSNVAFDCNYYKRINDSYRKEKVNVIGYYTIKGDSIYASLPIYFIRPGMVPKLCDANYRGFIKNKDTITDWKVIPPYPIKIGKFEKRFQPNSHLFEPQTLYFIKTDAIKCLQMD